MVASRESLVPASLLTGASCLLSARLDLAARARGVSPSKTGVTPAEQRVLDLLCQGLNNKQIAAALARSPSTVKIQVSSLLRKFGVPSRARLIALAR